MPGKKPKLPPVSDDVYEMESILGYKHEKNNDYFKIKWKNYSEEDATWEPRRNIIDPDEEQLELMKRLKNEYLYGRSESSQPTFKAQPTPVNRDTLQPENNFLKEESSQPTFKAQPTPVNRDTPLPENNFLKEETFPSKKNTKDSQNISANHDLDENTTSPNPNDEFDSPIDSKISSISTHQTDLFTGYTKSPESSEQLATSDNTLKAPYVVHIREVSKRKRVYMHHPDNGLNHTEGFFISLEEARTLYKDALLDYLLERVRFKPHSKRPSKTS